MTCKHILVRHAVIYTVNTHVTSYMILYKLNTPVSSDTGAFNRIFVQLLLRAVEGNILIMFL